MNTPTPTEAIADVLSNELPLTAASDLARAVTGYLDGLGYSIVHTDNHISKTELTKLADDLEYQTEEDDIDFATGIGFAVNAIRKLTK